MCNDVLCTPTQPRGLLRLVSEECFDKRGVVDARRSQSTSTCCDSRAVPFIAALALVGGEKGASAPCDIAVSLRKWRRRTFVRLSTQASERTMRQRRVFGLKSHKCNISRHIAVHRPRVRPPSSPSSSPPLPSASHQGLSTPSTRCLGACASSSPQHSYQTMFC